MRITALSGGVGGARFLRGLCDVLGDDDQVTVVGNTADDIWLFGLKICPDLDTLMYTLGGGIDEQRGWGRSDETWRAQEELAAYGVQPTWFGLGDRDLATHVVRTQMLRAGYPLGEVTAALCARWQPGVRLLPMSDDRVETHILIDDDAAAGRRAVHFQEYWVGMRAAPPVRGVVAVGVETATAAPGVVEAVLEADVVLLPPSNPIVSIGTIVAVAQIGQAVRETAAPVVGLSPIVGGAAVRGMADQLLAGLGIESSAAGIAEHYGARAAGGLLDGWLVHDDDFADVERVAQLGIECAAVPLLMSDGAATAGMARAALALAARLQC
ncbi:MAG: 2-phospho-L-lactate transferase [Nocardioidaceae bacterium]